MLNLALAALLLVHGQDKQTSPQLSAVLELRCSPAEIPQLGGLPMQLELLNVGEEKLVFDRALLVAGLPGVICQLRVKGPADEAAHERFFLTRATSSNRGLSGLDAFTHLELGESGTLRVIFGGAPTLGSADYSMFREAGRYQLQAVYELEGRRVASNTVVVDVRAPTLAERATQQRIGELADPLAAFDPGRLSSPTMVEQLEGLRSIAEGASSDYLSSLVRLALAQHHSLLALDEDRLVTLRGKWEENVELSEHYAELLSGTPFWREQLLEIEGRLGVVRERLRSAASSPSLAKNPLIETGVSR